MPQRAARDGAPSKEAQPERSGDEAARAALPKARDTLPDEREETPEAKKRRRNRRRVMMSGKPPRGWER